MASVIKFDEWQNSSGLTVATANAFGAIPGSVVQVKTTRYDLGFSLATGNWGS
jgi:hypothetical protein